MEKADSSIVTLYDGYLADFRDGKFLAVPIRNPFRLFCGMCLGNKRVTNMRIAGQLEGYRSFVVLRAGFMVECTEDAIFEAITEGLRVRVRVGDHLAFEASASTMMNGRDEVGPKTVSLAESIVVPARHSLEVFLDLSPTLCNAIMEAEEQRAPGCHTHIRFHLVGSVLSLSDKE